MKKILCLAVLILSAGSVFSQLYLRGNIGYNLPAGSESIGTKYKEVYDNQSGEYEDSEEAVNGSFGSGLSFHVGIGATLNGVLGYDVEVGYLLGKKYTVGYTYTDGFYTEIDEQETFSRSFQIAPSLTFTAGTGNIQPYTRVGPVIGITKLKLEMLQSDTYNNIEEKMEIEFTGGISLGFKGVLGVNFNAGKKLQFFGEASFVSMSYAPKEGEITGYTVDGENALGSIPKDERTIKFKDKVDSDDDNAELRQKYAMGSIGIQVGVKYMLK